MQSFRSANGRPQIFKLVLTGGPCGGKTTGQARLSSFFENLGWKVYRVPEAASVMLGGGVKFQELSSEQTYQFQVDLLNSIMAIERTFDNLARSSDRKCLIICDRGCMDAVGYMTVEMWERAKRETGWNDVEMRDSRYDLILHMVTAARGAEAFYSVENNRARMENDLDLARERDDMASRAWLGHPYLEVVDNSTGFEEKIRRMIALVCERVDVKVGDRLSATSLKRKFLVRVPPGVMRQRVEYVDFDVEHDYLANSTEKRQSRIRKRGRNGVWTYQHTLRFEVNGQLVETKTTLTQRDYKALRAQRSTQHETIYKTRRCFLYESQYFQLDTFREPCPARCRGLRFLETYTTAAKGKIKLPDFLEVIREVTGQRDYSLFTLSLIVDSYSADWPPLGKSCSNSTVSSLNGIIDSIATDKPTGRHKSVSFNHDGGDETYGATTSNNQSPTNGHADTSRELAGS